MALFFFLFLSALSSAVAVDVREMSIDEYINFVNPPAVHKYQNNIGDSMLCVKFSDQISVKYALDNITRGLKTVPKVKSSTLNISNSNFGGENISMVGLESECPQDTVAIREIKREDVERAGSVRQYLNSRGRRRKIIIPNDNSVIPLAGSLNEYAFVRFNSSADPVRTVSANLNVWNPYVAPSGFFSSSQVWAFNFATHGLLGEAIEVGWMVYPRRYGDSKPRLFIHWTNDDYASGCYDLDCAGFVRGGGNVSPGGQLQPISVFDGTQYHILVTLEWQDPGPATGPIWNLFVQNQHVGHFPGTLFSRLREGAAKVYIGGGVGYAEIAQGTRLSNTQMGSGRFPERGYRRAAYSRITQITGRSGSQIQHYDTYISKHLCYRAIYHGDQRTVFFGGTGGQNPKCVAT